MEDRIGVENREFEYILAGMNPERILIAAKAVGLGKLALSRAAEYAKTRIVFNRPIGKNQASSIRWRRTGSSSRRLGSW